MKVLTSIRGFFILMIFTAGFINSASAQAINGIYESYAILSINGGANAFYDMNATTGNPDLQAANLGIFKASQSLVVKGGQNKTYKCNGGNITNGHLNWRVWLTSSGASGSFTVVNMFFVSNDAGGCGGNQTWQGTGGATNIISSLTVPGNYTLEIYSDADGVPGTTYSSNGGANYKANFCFAPAPTGSGSQTFCSGAKVADLTPTGSNIKWYDAATGGTLLGNTTALVNNAHYYASQTTGSCESVARLDVTVTITGSNESMADFRSIASGNFNNPAIWQYHNACGNWVIATTAPGPGNACTIQSGFACETLNTDPAISIKSLIIESGASITPRNRADLLGTAAGATLSVSGSLNIQPMGGDIHVYGNILVTTGGSVSNDGSISLDGDIVVNGSFEGTNGTLTFDGDVHQAWTDNTVAGQQYGSVVVNKPAGRVGRNPQTGKGIKIYAIAGELDMGSAPFEVAGDVIIEAGAILKGETSYISVTGDWTINGTFDPGSGTVEFKAIVAPSVIQRPLSTTFNNLKFSGSAGAILQSEVTVTGMLTLAAGTLSLATGTTLAIAGDLTVGIGNIDASASGCEVKVVSILNPPSRINVPETLFTGPVIKMFTIGEGSNILSFPELSIWSGTIAVTKASGLLELGSGSIFAIGDGGVTASGTAGIDASTTNSELQFTGSSSLVIPPNTLKPGVVYSLTMNKTGEAGVSLSGDISIGSLLSFTSGVISTGSNTLIIEGAATVSGASATTGHVNGKIKKKVFNVLVERFAVGGPAVADYTPVQIDFASPGTTNTTGNIEVSTAVLGTAPPVASGLSQGKYIDRSWTVTNNGVSFASTYDATFNFVDGDMVGSPNTNALQISKLDGSTYSTPTVVVPVTNGVQATGLVSFSTFYIGEAACNSGEWTGAVSSDWFTAANWCDNAVPDSSTDVTIPPGTPHSPVINGQGVCAKVVIRITQELTVSGNGSLTVHGDWVNDGSFIANNSKVIFTGGSGAATIGGASTSQEFYDLEINGGAITEIHDNINALNITHDLTITKGQFKTGLNAVNVSGRSSITTLGSVVYAGTWGVAGDLTNEGTLTGSPSSILTFNGSAPQEWIDATGSSSSYGSIVIASGAIVITSEGNFDVHMTGDWTNDGTFDPGNGTSTIVFDGSNPQMIGGTVSTTFNNVTFDNSSGLTEVLVAAGMSGVLALTIAQRVKLNENDLTLSSTASITGANSTSYIVTNGTGSLKRYVSNDNVDVEFPIGSTTTSYTPVRVHLSTTSTPENISSRVADGVYTSYNPDGTPEATASAIIGRAVLKSFFTAGDKPTGQQRTMTVQWNDVDEAPGFDHTASGLAQYTNGAWDYNSSSDATSLGGGTYSQSRSGITSLSTFAVFSQETITLNMKLFLQAYYIGNGTMQAVLNNQGITTAHATETDNITVELHDVTDPTITVNSTVAMLNTDGTVSAKLIQAAGTYWIAIRHRSSLQTWTAAPVVCSASTPLYDFTLGANMAFGDTQVELDPHNEPGIFGFYVGDLNQDDFIDAFDYSSFNDDNLAGVSNEYVNTDMNGDGFVDAFDYSQFNDNNLAGIMSVHP